MLNTDLNNPKKYISNIEKKIKNITLTGNKQLNTQSALNSIKKVGDLMENYFEITKEYNEPKKDEIIQEFNKLRTECAELKLPSDILEVLGLIIYSIDDF